MKILMACGTGTEISGSCVARGSWNCWGSDPNALHRFWQHQRPI